MEETWEQTLAAEDATDRMNVDEEGEGKGEATTVVRKSLESIKDAEKIIEVSLLPRIPFIFSLKLTKSLGRQLISWSKSSKSLTVTTLPLVRQRRL